ncbi:hypothetical protein ACW2QC_09265 [Virgibacillus sp. FSP13]
MMEKVMLTKEQAEAVDYFKKTFVENKATSMTNKTLRDALNHGYEIMSEFEVGDWLTVEYDNKTVGTVVEIYEDKQQVELDCRYYTYKINELRHATKTEIAEEKERRWWASHNRGVWELREGDLLIEEDGDLFSIAEDVHLPKEDVTILIKSNLPTKTETISSVYIRNKCRIVCFNENRLDGDQ